MFDVSVIGHVVRDVNTIGGSEYEPSPGGTAYYSAIVYASLGLRTAVVTKVARQDEDALLGPLRRAGVEVFNLATERTAVFRNYYAPDNSDIRMQHVDARAGGIFLEDLPPLRARLVHVGPLTKEDIDPTIIRHYAKLGVTVALDAQGLTRDIVGGEVVASHSPGLGAFLRHVDVFQADDEEIVTFTGLTSVTEAAERVRTDGAGTVIVTKASRGSLVFGPEGMMQIPAVPPRRRLDATGCGDTYLAAFMSRRLRGERLAECASFAAVAASLNIENRGPLTGSTEDVFDRWSEFARDEEPDFGPPPTRDAGGTARTVPDGED
jgi:sugar/nucleoside kinase (ribokinase family)